jgi:hypothetical protein
MLAIAETHARLKAKRFYRPSRDGRVFLHHFPVRQLPDTGLLSLSPFLLRPCTVRVENATADKSGQVFAGQC